MDESLDALVEAYAGLVVRVGVNLQPGQRLVVRGMVEHAPVARAVAAAAYRAGASHVTVLYVDQHLHRLAVEHAPQDRLGRSLPSELAWVRALRPDGAALVTLTGNPNPDVMTGADPARLAASVPRDLVRELLPLLAADQIRWTMVGAPNPGWATSLFGEPDVARLWRAVAVAVRADEDDPVAAWRAHLADLEARRDLLDARRFDAIRFRGPGTDLVVGLSPRSRWLTAGHTAADGHGFVVNLPTEEVYTAPDWRRAEGTVRTTAPFYLAHMSTLVEGLSLELSDGAIRAAHADRGEAAVRRELDTVPRARHLGEVAIVDGSSRVRRAGLAFRDMLFDENVGSHIAWGNGYPTTFAGAEDLDPDARVAAGLNQAPTHVDVVVGSPEVEVDGLDAAGRAVPILRGDAFVLVDA
ncbi:aminopeptidase [Cellulomonas aerilata]|uniref:Leucyl aminopeptidase n=1 Tax=Cellulomonas aerilata TaxID=515326 RepID=A0A512DCT3_9CELL|nr:aminopeptidase [Cellulomonas aerilata]GEO34273.1 leucyl aminopeptidase [Cellulomonas aerilata]